MKKNVIVYILFIFTLFLHGWNSMFYHTHKAITDDTKMSLIEIPATIYNIGYMTLTGLCDLCGAFSHDRCR